MASEENSMEKIQCKNPKCKKEFPRKSFLTHLARSTKKACKKSYTDEELQSFKSSSKQIHIEKTKVANRKGYNEERKKEMARRYQKNKKAISRKYKENKENAKKESTPEQRILEFRHANQHGPIFTCISCHRDLFKKGVKELTNTLESKIRTNGMYK